MKKEASKKKTVKSPAKQVKKPMPKKASVKAKPIKTSKTTKPAPKKTPKKTIPVKTAKSAPKIEKKPVFKPAITIEKSAIKPIEKPIEKPLEKPPEKPLNTQQQDMSLPEGNVLQQTGHRRPLIVFPK